MLTNFVEKSKIDINVVVEWIVKEIENESAETAMEAFLEDAM